MGGLIGTGISYENSALSGMVRESQEQQQIDMANKQMHQQEDAQTQGEIGAGVGMVAMIAMMALM